MSPSLSENVDRKEKLVEAYFYAINETHAKNYSSSVIKVANVTLDRANCLAASRILTIVW